jgi:hypothetical protein
MSMAALHADAFMSEALANRAVWAIRDYEGFPTSTNSSGQTAMPFWSTERRAQRIIEGVAAYQNFKPVRLELEVFVERWLSGLERDGLYAGLNWSGERATGYDMLPKDVRARLAAARTNVR